VKLALTTSGENLAAPLHPRFARAPRFLVFDTEIDLFEIVDNQAGVDAAHGAGIHAAETLARLGVRALVTGHCGPKALTVLVRAGIEVYNTDAKTVAEAIEACRSGTLVAAEPA
jgi:predicted Fe-Mo cluster-binding NifX family protein